MGETGVHRLYLAKSLQELNCQVHEIPKAAPKMLVNTAQRVLKEAQAVDKVKDEEKAYVLYMRYFSIVLTIQKHSDYKKNKKYYDGLLDPKMTVKVINRAEELQKSLENRYGFISTAIKLEQLEEEKRIAERLEQVEKEKEAKKVAETVKPTSTAVTNGLAEEDGFIFCKKLYSLMKEKCSTYLILDTRPSEDFSESQMALPNVINISEDILNPGLIAGRIGSELDESSCSLWVKHRHTVDYLILVDWNTEHLPLTTPLKTLVDAMVKWDPGKPYKSRPWVLLGGYEMWQLMYPMHTTNPRAKPRNPSVMRHQEPVSLNFEYPDLDKAFLITPSPSPGAKTAALPTVKPPLKPIVTEELMDSKNNNKNINNNLDISKVYNNETEVEGSPIKVLLDSKINTWNIKDSNRDLDYQKTRKISNFADKVDNTPSIPSRALKPRELLANLAAKKLELDEEQELLEQSMKVEEDTIKKIEEMEATTTQRETARDEQSRAQLQQTEKRLQEEIDKLQAKSSDMEEQYNKIHKQNEELWRMVNLALSGRLSNLNLEPTAQLDHDAEAQLQKEDQDRLQKQEDKRKALQEQVERMRKERKEKEKRLKEQAEKEKLLSEQKAQEAEIERQKLEERRSRVDGESRSLKTKGTGGETYTTKLRGSPRSSPVRAGSNLKRSHSAFNLSQLEDDDDKMTFGSTMPSFDRGLKPLGTPQRRNINAARQRNFEPRYGSVPPAKTGLKNLGNTCYMNSVIQCLNNTTPLVKYFIEGTYSDDINSNSKYRGEVAEEVGAVIRALWCGQYRSIAMRDLKSAVGRFHKPFQGYDQHDSHEFLIKLMDWVHEDLNKVVGKKPPMKEQNNDDLPDYVAAEKVMEDLRRQDQSIIHSIFNGLHRSIIVCGTCSNRSLTFEPFSILSLSFPSSSRCSLRDMFHHFYKETNIEYKCSKCKKMRNCIRKLDIWKLPPILILHLNRFEHDVLMKKQQNFVDFPLDNLELKKQCGITNRYTNFDLYGVSNHYGTMDGGHYTAFCKSVLNKQWYKFDDHEVYELSRDAVKSSAAYLLFYEASNMNVKVTNLI
nr:ubiquitin carboxyl-terminal hydrolase 8-like [Procambarus clarkii]XP_045621601.1 ubiquitin carboxyl-terminal hydrolase 8-like [Procambarus clarkii]XP_045621602.1 ubiquitin carboxyl-terminal hydrolase 8-like [Procambarus clarkii]